MTWSLRNSQAIRTLENSWLPFFTRLLSSVFWFLREVSGLDKRWFKYRFPVVLAAFAALALFGSTPHEGSRPGLRRIPSKM